MQSQRLARLLVGEHRGPPVVEQDDVELAPGRRRASCRSRSSCTGSSARRSPNAAAAGGTPRDRESVGTTFSMPTSVISSRGSVTHMRPLPSDSTTQTTAGVGDREVGAAEARPYAQELLAQELARGRGQVLRLDRSSCSSCIVRWKMSRISARLRCSAGTTMCDGRSVAELDDQVGEIGLVRRDAGGLERVVQPRLVGGHRLDLDDLRLAARPG